MNVELLDQMLSGLEPAERAAAWDEITTELSQFEAGGHFTAPCEMLVAAGTKP